MTLEKLENGAELTMTLVSRLTDDISYSYANGKNMLRLTKKKGKRNRWWRKSKT